MRSSLLSAGVTSCFIFLSCSLSVREAAATVRYVAPGASCGGVSPCYGSLQAAVDDAASDDEIRVAEGTYTGVSTENGVTALLHFRERNITLTIRGGFTTTNWQDANPEDHPVVLDAQDQGIVGFIRCVSCSGSLVLDGVHLTGGQATETVSGVDDGGGLHVENTSYLRVTVQNCRVHDNAAEDGGAGGLYFESSDDATIRNCIVENNTGGGIELVYSDSPDVIDNIVRENTLTGITVISGLGRVNLRGNTVSRNGRGILLMSLLNATVEDNTINENTAGTSEAGGGIQVRFSTAHIRNNLILDNTSDRGGGIDLDGGSGLVVENNRIENNRATASSTSEGGGLYAGLGSDSDLLAQNNEFLSNEANGQGGGAYVVGNVDNIVLNHNTFFGNSGSLGGGLFVNTGTVSDNTFRNNSARLGGGLYSQVYLDLLVARCLFENNSASEDGGGAYLSLSQQVRLERTRFTGNDATGSGGGLYATWRSPNLDGHIDIENTVVAGNTAGSGCGISIYGGAAALTHVTVANNGDGARDDGVGIVVRPFGVVQATLTNTIIAGQTTGLVAQTDAEVSLDGTLWGGGAWDNDEDTAGGGTITTGTTELWGDPLFVSPSTNDYHVLETSPAVDAAVDAGVTEDLDGQVRPNPGTGLPDIGADEFWDAGGRCDADGSGTCDALDLAHLIRCAADAAGCGCPGDPDLDASGSVDHADIELALDGLFP